MISDGHSLTKKVTTSKCYSEQCKAREEEGEITPGKEI